MVLGSMWLKVVISEESPAKKYHAKFDEYSYYLQADQINQYKYWSTGTKFAIWFANDHWCIGDDKDKGTETCSIKAPGSSDQLPTDLEGQWLYWNPDSKEWIKAGNDITVTFRWKLPFNQDSIE